MYPYSSATADSPGFHHLIEELIPQSKAMVLLDRVVEVGEQHIVAELTVRADGLFSGPEYTVPAWVGIEYMAQSVAAFSGYHRKCKGEAIGLGFLLGSRHYQCSAGSFPCGSTLVVRAEKIIEAANDMSVFDCTVDGLGIKASGRLNVMLPQDSKKFLTGKGI
jgi:predicted hotdog family 3-hydroxylacyl-ACP dehydratase